MKVSQSESTHSAVGSPDEATTVVAPGTHIVGRLGWHTVDTACPIGPGTWAAACAATDVAATAAQLVLDGEDAAYALCRPPGHHAYRDLAGGFCFLNNSAVAAAAWSKRFWNLELSYAMHRPFVSVAYGRTTSEAARAQREAAKLKVSEQQIEDARS